MRLVLFLFIGLIVFVSCEKSDEATPVFEYYLHAELAPYFERFEQEGAERGINIDLFAAGIQGHIELLDNGVAGTCSYQPDEPRQVTIDRRYWLQAGDRDREYVIFHELGHCFLERPHLDLAGPNGQCESIMESGVGKCLKNYTEITREAYLDELFGS